MNKASRVFILLLLSLSLVVSHYSGLNKISLRVLNRRFKNSAWQFQYPPFSNTSSFLKGSNMYGLGNPDIKNSYTTSQKRIPRPIQLHRHDEFLSHLIQNFKSIHDLNRLQLSGEKKPGGQFYKKLSIEPIPSKYVAPRIGP